MNSEKIKSKLYLNHSEITVKPLSDFPVSGIGTSTILQTYIKKRIIRQFYKKVETTAIHSLQTIHALRIFFSNFRAEFPPMS